MPGFRQQATPADIVIGVASSVSLPTPTADSGGRYETIAWVIANVGANPAWIVANGETAETALEIPAGESRNTPVYDFNAAHPQVYSTLGTTIRATPLGVGSEF